MHLYVNLENFMFKKIDLTQYDKQSSWRIRGSEAPAGGIFTAIDGAMETINPGDGISIQCNPLPRIGNVTCI